MSDNLYVYEDTCKVYIVKNGKEAVLIDFGSGDVLAELPGIGVERVAAVLMTHHHRDQGQGLQLAADAGIPILVPHTEQDLFHSISEHWQARELVNDYNMRQDRFSLLDSVPVYATLKDYSVRECAGREFRILPTPGHTTGSITILAEIDGRRTAFTGDLIAGPGKVWNMAATQWSYNGAEGVAASIPSLLDLKEQQPDVLLPSHGQPMERPEEAIDLLIDRFRELLRHRGQNPRLFELHERPYERLLPHLLKSRASISNYYVVLSKSGKALFIDFGYDFLTGIAAGADRASRRPWLHNIGRLKRDYGVRSVDAVLLTHYHDDHVAGCNLLRDNEGAEVWAAENFADILEHPDRYDLPCLWYDPVAVDRVLPLERTISWEEYEFTLYEQAGHTLYAVAVAFEADGTRVLAVGDQHQGEDVTQWNYVYRNRFRSGDYAASAALYAKLRPELILTGHSEPLRVQPGYFERLAERGRVLEELHRRLLPEETAGFGAEGTGVRITPYQIRAAAGSTITVDIEVRNPSPEEEEITVRLTAPAAWNILDGVHTVRLAGGAAATLRSRIDIPEGENARRARIAADLTAGTRRFGQLAEALVTVYG